MTTDIQLPPLPFDDDNIYSWYLHFQGQYRKEDGVLRFDPSLSLNLSYANRITVTESNQAIPNEVYLDLIASEALPLELNEVPNPDAVMRDEPWTSFKQGGYWAEFNLENWRPPNPGNPRVIGSTENVSIRATLRNDALYRGGEGSNDHPDVYLNIPAKASLAMIIDKLPFERSLTTPENVDLSTYKNLRPIIYLEQSETGFFLVAEITDRDGHQRVLLSFSTQDKQHWVISRPYSVMLLPAYTIRVHQDGDITQPQEAEKNGHLYRYRYFEFWVNNLPLGIYGLPSIEFPFKETKTKVGIAYWPREESDGGPVYYTGNIDEIIFDPHDVCPGC